MSDLWRGESAASAVKVSPFAVRPPKEPFHAWTGRAADGIFGASDYGDAGHESPASKMLDIETIKGEAYAEGLTAGRRMAEAELASERQALQALARTLQVLQPEPPAALGLMLAETVGRLVRQIAGEVVLDEERVIERATAAAALIGERSAPARMRLNPADVARVGAAGLPVELVGDPSLAQGSVRLETPEGSIEDGPEIALEQLRIALDRMGIAR